MKVKWLRGNAKIRYDRPHTWEVLGYRNSGKSTFLEVNAEKYLERGHCVLDLWGSRDGENLAWLRSKWAKEKQILLIHGDNIKVTSEHDVKNVKDVSPQDFYDYDILISASPLYANADQQFLETNRLTDLLYKRFTWKRLVYTIVREASNLYYSRLKVSENQLTAKASFIYMLREARHMGVALGLDTLRYYALDIDIRSLADYIIIKSLGVHGLPKDLRFLYRYFQPSFISNMKPEQFVILTKRGHLGCGVFPEISWHKQERENILKKTCVQRRYVSPVDIKEEVDKGTYTTVGDLEHSKMIKFFLEGFGNDRIARKMQRSKKTIGDHRRKHNQSIVRVGYCPKCKRVNSPLENTRV